MDQKTQFIADYLRKRLSITELCELYGISRKTVCGLFTVIEVSPKASTPAMNFRQLNVIVGSKYGQPQLSSSGAGSVPAIGASERPIQLSVWV